MKKLALITKTVSFRGMFSGEVGALTYSQKETVFRFLGILIYRETISKK